MNNGQSGSRAPRGSAPAPIATGGATPGAGGGELQGHVRGGGWRSHIWFPQTQEVIPMCVQLEGALAGLGAKTACLAEA